MSANIASPLTTINKPIASASSMTLSPVQIRLVFFLARQGVKALPHSLLSIIRFEFLNLVQAFSTSLPVSNNEI